MNDYKWLKIFALLEGTSLVLLVFIGLPFKYYLGMPELVKIIGPLHGVLFIIFVVLLFMLFITGKLGLKKMLVGVIASFIPTGTFIYKEKCL
jgi:integral membrane protein